MDLASVAFELGKARARTPAEYFVANQTDRRSSRTSSMSIMRTLRFTGNSQSKAYFADRISINDVSVFHRGYRRGTWGITLCTPRRCVFRKIKKSYRGACLEGGEDSAKAESKTPAIYAQAILLKNLRFVGLLWEISR